MDRSEGDRGCPVPLCENVDLQIHAELEAAIDQGSTRAELRVQIEPESTGAQRFEQRSQRLGRVLERVVFDEQLIDHL